MFKTIHPTEPAGEMEQRLEQVSGERWPLDVDAIRRAQDPWTCPEHLLPWLAHSRGVRLWFDDWPEFRKRQAIALWPDILRNIGKMKAIRLCLLLVDAPLKGYDLPPKRPYLGASLTGERRQRWLAHLPQLRLYEHRSRYEGESGARYLGRNFVLRPGGAICGPDPAAVYYGVRAYLWKDGEETALKVHQLERFSETKFSEKTVRVHLPPRRLTAFRTGGPLSYLRPDGDARAQFMTVTLTESAVSSKADIRIREYALGYEPVDTRYEEVAEAYTPEPSARFLGRCTPGGSFGSRMLCGRDPAYLHLYQRVYLYDEAATQYAHRPSGTFALNSARLGMKPFTGHLKVDIREPSPPRRFRVGGTLGAVTTLPHTRLRRAIEAVKVAQGGTDAFVIHTDIFTPVTLGDRPRLDGSVRLGQMLRRF